MGTPIEERERERPELEHPSRRDASASLLWMRLWGSASLRATFHSAIKSISSYSPSRIGRLRAARYQSGEEKCDDLSEPIQCGGIVEKPRCDCGSLHLDPTVRRFEQNRVVGLGVGFLGPQQNEQMTECANKSAVELLTPPYDKSLTPTLASMR